MKLKSYLLFAACVLLSSSYLQAQDITENSFGEGLINVVAKDSSYGAKLAFRFQSLFSSNWIHPEDEGLQFEETNFLIRRSRLKLGGFAFTPKLQYKLELGLSNRDMGGASDRTNNAPRYLLDAVIKWNFYENFVLWAGQTKLPGNRERLISSGDLETVDRSLLNSRFNIDRDMGIQLHHSFFIGENFLVKEILALSQGEGRNVTAGNLGGYQYTGKLEFLPLGDFSDYKGADLEGEQTPKFAVGISYDHNDDAVRTRSNMGDYMIIDAGYFETDIRSFFLDAIFKYKGLSLMGEYANRNAENPVALNSDGTPTGEIVNVGDAYNFQAGYVFKNNYQITGRFTSINLDQDLFDGIERQYTLGLSKYFAGHKLKVQTDLSYSDLDSGFNDGFMYRLQFDIHL